MRGNGCFSLVVFAAVAALLFSCGGKMLKPLVKTEKLIHDSDDPAIWINASDVNKSIIFGTDKESEGAIYAFTLDGKVIEDKTIRNIRRPNNVDIEYGLTLQGKKTDIIVFTEREREMLRVYSVPDMKPLDHGGIPVFVGESSLEFRAPMGVALYKDPATGQISAILSRKLGPTGEYLWQYQLEGDGDTVNATVVRKFGLFQGGKEIEAVAVDDAAGYIYYSDEGYGIHQYHANPKSGDAEIMCFGKEEFKQDIEGIGILSTGKESGYLFVSDQQLRAVRIYDRAGDHAFIKSVKWKSRETDGLEVTTETFDGKFPGGLLVAMSEGKVFHFYGMERVLGK